MTTSINKYVQIQIKGLKNNNIFNDRKYVTDVEFELDGDDTKFYETDETYNSFEYQNIRLVHNVVAHKFEKGELIFNITETSGLDNIKIADDILVINKDNLYFQCKLLDYVFEKLFDSTLIKVTCSLMILKQYPGAGANKEYILNENVIYDYASSTYVLSKLLNYYKLTLTNYELIDGRAGPFVPVVFYTKLYPKLSQSDNIVLDENTLENGDIIVNKVISFSIAKAKFYLSELQIIDLKIYAEICHYRDNFGANYGNVLENESGTIKYTGIKHLTYTINDKIELQNLGLWDVDIIVYYDKINYSPQNNKSSSIIIEGPR